ncbi:PHP domain-containing protein [Halobacteria archaeon AArc-m2/3/4]|uniref:histidinol-phosphatase n=1 Tax=Natronoglomus mannanivorans TaxID=2979990 RepID=A0ABT2QHV6_9EURY|nr:PHP domain-containing protein [Halobacteria archaeon AArc-m2/3/4]
MTLPADYHAHSNYSDGRPLPSMVAAAADAGLEAIGITDHCNVSSRELPQRAKRKLGFNLDQTYGRRREALRSLREQAPESNPITIYDAVELDYDPRDESEIERFLEDAAFDYTIGSVHVVDDANIFDREYFAAKSESELQDLVAEYYDKVVALIESELFDVVGHVDAIERTPELRGYTTQAHYERVAEALEFSPTVPEINAGRVLEEYGHFHPAPAFLEAIQGRDVQFVPGTDSHRPAELLDRLPVLEERFADLDLEPVTPFSE